jgi:hypothetical protein
MAVKGIFLNGDLHLIDDQQPNEPMVRAGNICSYFFEDGYVFGTSPKKMLTVSLTDQSKHHFKLNDRQSGMPVASLMQDVIDEAKREARGY